MFMKIELTQEELRMIRTSLQGTADSMRFYGSYSEYEESKEYSNLSQKISKHMENSNED
tara:strand:+ start:273 stop:449 length:177 start_codon:yes stop_codon:yes gene_type:complete